MCELFANLSNFTLVKFPCKRQHFRRKPSGWVNAISDCVRVRVCVLYSVYVRSFFGRGWCDSTQSANKVKSGAVSSFVVVSRLEVSAHWGALFEAQLLFHKKKNRNVTLRVLP